MKPRNRRERMLVSLATQILSESFELLTEGRRTGDNNRDGNIGEFMTGYSLGTDDFTKPNIGGDYEPDISVSNYIHIFHGDEIFGKFNRIAVYKAGALGSLGRLRVLKGPSLK